MQIIVLKNNSKELILRTDNDKLYSFLGFGDLPARVHPPCHLYLLYCYCPMNASYTNMFNNYMYLAVEDRKSANLFVGHVLSDEWNPYHYVKKSANKSKEKDVEKVGKASEEGTLIKSTVDKATKIAKDDAKTIQDEKDIQMEASIAATEKELKDILVNIENEYNASESMEEAPLKPLFIFPLPLKQSDPDSLISYVNQSLMRASYGMKELD